MTSNKQSFTRAEIKAGVLVIASVAVLALFIAVIQGLRPPEVTKVFYAYLTDTGGLNPGADVRFGGARVGRVSAIDLDASDQSRLRVEMTVRRDVPVNEESEAFITQVTLMAQKHLEITTGSSGAALVEGGSEIPARSGSMISQAEKLAQTVAGVIEDVQNLLGVEAAVEAERQGGEEMVTLADLFSDVDRTVNEGTGLVRDARGDVMQILAKVKDVEDRAKSVLESLSAVLSENRDDIRGSVAGVRGIVDDVSTVSDELEEIASTLEATLGNAASLTGEARGLLEGSGSDVEEIILDLRETVRYLKLFARTLAEQPQAVIRGKAPEGRE